MIQSSMKIIFFTVNIVFVSMKKKKVSFFTIIGSVLSAFLGVQSSNNHKRDFESNRTKEFLLAVVICVLLFVIIIFLLAKYAFFVIH